MTVEPYDPTRPSAPELARAREWFDTSFGADGGRPLAFLYNGVAVDLSDWELQRQPPVIGDSTEERTLRWHDSATGLTVRCVAVLYTDFPTVEWTVYLHNDGDVDTPVVADLVPLHAAIAGPEGCECLLHHHVGSPCLASDYEPLVSPLATGQAKVLATSGGRSTNAVLSYFNIEWQPPLPRPDGWAPPTPSLVHPDSTGVILAIGR